MNGERVETRKAAPASGDARDRAPFLLGDLEWVKHAYVEMTEIVLVPGGDDEAVHSGRGGNHGVLNQLVRAAVHEATPLTKGTGVHWQNLV